MQNAGLTIGMVAIGLGLASIGFNLNGNQANATTAAPVAFNAGPEEPTIVWYDTVSPQSDHTYLYRAWSDGRVEGRMIESYSTWNSCNETTPCVGPWVLISSPDEGLNAAADINHDEIVNAADIGLLVAAWGDAPRNPMPPSDCPLGLIQ